MKVIIKATTAEKMLQGAQMAKMFESAYPNKNEHVGWRNEVLYGFGDNNPSFAVCRTKTGSIVVTELGRIKGAIFDATKAQSAEESEAG